MIGSVRKVIIPVAGLGTRFRPVTRTVPKELLPISSKPVLEWILEECAHAMMDEVILVTRPEKNAIQDYFKDSFTCPKTNRILQIKYVQQTEPLGLGHAILQGRSRVGSDPFFAVALPDELLLNPQRAALAQLLKPLKDHHPRIGLINVPREETCHYGVAAFEITPTSNEAQRITAFVEKPNPKESPSNWILPGRYILPNSIFSILEEQRPHPISKEIHLTDAMTKLCAMTTVMGVPLDVIRFDTGRMEGYLRANIFSHFILNPAQDTLSSLTRDIEDLQRNWRSLT